MLAPVLLVPSLLIVVLVLDGTLGLVSRQTKFLIRQQLQLPVLGFFGNALSTIDNDPDADINEKQKKDVPDVKVLLQRQPTKVLLLSLQHPEFTGRFSKTVADVWKWKDAVLGDGRDYFIPRPKTLAALQRYLISQVEIIHTIVVLSNCARMELLLIIRPSQQETSTQQIDRDDHSAALPEAMSRALLLQVHDFQCQRLFGLPPMIDWPSAIAINPVTEHSTTELNEQVKELAQHWKTYDTMQSVLTHWCQVAAGLSGRPNRPERYVAFRPFSSRDAHIMLQLKRLVLMDGVGPHNKMVSKWIVDTALSAGKAARSNVIVQAHRPFLLDSTQGMPLTIAQQVQDEILEPLIQRALSQWYTKSASGVIQMIRQQALELANTDEERQWIQRTQLHNVTMVLRQEYQTFDTESFLTGLQQRLQAHKEMMDHNNRGAE